MMLRGAAWDLGMIPSYNLAAMPEPLRNSWNAWKKPPKAESVERRVYRHAELAYCD